MHYKQPHAFNLNYVGKYSIAEADLSKMPFCHLAVQLSFSNDLSKPNKLDAGFGRFSKTNKKKKGMVKISEIETLPIMVFVLILTLAKNGAHYDL